MKKVLKRGEYRKDREGSALYTYEREFMSSDFSGKRT